MKYSTLLSPPHPSGAELELLREALESGWIAPLGPQVDAFEAELCGVTGNRAALALCSGSAAIHLAVRALGVAAGDDVFCSTLTFVASANPILYERANPVFIDSDERTWNMDADLLAEALSAAARTNSLPSAVIVTDLLGQCADYDRIEAECAQWGVPIVEDAAESLGASYKGRPAGGFGDYSILSFNGNKIITTSGGGALLSRDPEALELPRFLSTQARDDKPHYEHSTVGYNYRLSNLLAAVGRAQLQVLDERVASRRSNFESYRENLSDLPGLSFMPEPEECLSTRWLTCMTIDPGEFGADREQLREWLAERAIESRPIWKPMHRQPLFRDARVVGGSVAERIFETGLCLPSGSNLGSSELDEVVSAVRQCWRSHN